jgi:NAD(P)-dependent dehydrogenase (short-subunit alcohol dehydrogenase family)
VNAIAPGLLRTPATERLLSNAAAAKTIAAQYPLGRHGEAADAAALAALLLSDAAGWISGQVIGLDGGFGAVRPYVKTA